MIAVVGAFSFSLTPSLVQAGPVANAAALPAPYSGSTHGDILSLGLNAAGIANIDAILGHARTATDSTRDPRAHAESANLEAGALGIPVSVVSDQANSNNATPTDSYNTGLGQVDVPGVLDTGLLTGSGSTVWAGDAACVPDGQPISTADVSLAGATLGIQPPAPVPAINILTLGTVTTSGNTALNAGSVVSTTSGNLTSLSLLNQNVQVDVVSNPTLTATSNGTTGTVTANNYAIDVTVGGTTTRLTAGASLPVNVDLGGGVIASLKIGVGGLTDNSSGATASGSMTFINITGTIVLDPPLLPPTTLATINLGLLPLSATATAPTGGVQCSVLQPPVITSPTEGSTTSESPTITGTGVPGATVTVTENGTIIGTATVGSDGTWSLVPSTPLSPGPHTIEATQKSSTAASGASAPVTFTVIDQTPPAAPVITGPVAGSTIGDSTPTISGTGEPGATVTVSEGATVLCTATVDATGNWSCDSSTLPDGSHTVTATQADAAGNVSAVSAPDTFTVDSAVPAAPVIAGPVDGSMTSDSTPAISGTGEPGATVTVSEGTTVLCTATVAADGTWSCDSSTLSDGSHTITATQADAAGNVSAVSAPDTFTVDSAVPAAPVIAGPVDGSMTSDSTPAISGTGEPGATVTVSEGTTVLCTATVAADGTWSCDSSTLSDGSHTITAT
ncbi:Ig-like domain-containing protein, partial [Amycolatopsis sp. SID8362]|uniref:Ig-like domain-containing protein n=1 Tax=Amycolatopsis sp. SID8362 TaxID=2690346 RepID=UPI0028161E2F